jgi:hypothetical protein
MSVFETISVGLDKLAVEAKYPGGVAFFRTGPSHRGENVLRSPVIHERNAVGTRITASPDIVAIEDSDFGSDTVFQNCNWRNC